jgi:alpha-glucosidase
LASTQFGFRRSILLPWRISDTTWPIIAELIQTSGRWKDFDCLLAEVHRRGMRMILDFVPNHTSEQHPWFVESRSSRENPKRDWYLWRDEPNNWLSHFGGSGWEWDETTQQHYYHSFLKEQPDLNWRNPAVQEAMFDVLRFWLRRGVDGFRVDVMWLLIKDEQFRDNLPNPGYRQGQPSNNRLLPVYNSNRPEATSWWPGCERWLTNIMSAF